MTRFSRIAVPALALTFAAVAAASARVSFEERPAVAGSHLPEALAGQELRPLSLASADFDGDGVPDLAAGFGAPEGGVVVLYRGNGDALYPNSPDARQRRDQGRFVAEPFLPTGRVLTLSAPPDFLFAGDFDADGLPDLAAAASGSRSIALMRGDGAGGFGQATVMSVPGRIAAMTSGDAGRRDGLADLVAAVEAGAGPQALVYQGPEGALRAAPISIALEEPAAAVAIERAEGGATRIVTRSVSGRDRRIERAGRAWRLADDDDDAERSAASASTAPEPEVAASLPLRVGPHAGGRIVLRGDGSLSAYAPAAATTFVVDVTTDLSDASPGNGICADAGGGCSFRAAIQEANAHAGADTITFAIPGAGVPQISTPALPVVVETLTIDGTTQAAGKVMVTGTSNGMVITLAADDCVLRGIVLNGTGNNGLKLQGNDNVVEGNFFGTTADGTATQGGMFGPNVSVVSGSGNLIGGTAPAARNVIAGGSYGIYLTSGSTIIQGNFIGTDVTGTVGLGSSNQGIRAFTGDGNTIGGATAGAGNLVSGQGGAGISLDTDGNLVQGNRIGTDAAGISAIPNSQFGVIVYFSADNTLGGTAAGAGNLVSGNGTGGIQVNASGVNPITNTIVQGNRIGTNADGSAALANGGHGLYIVAGTNVQIGGASAGARNLISGNLFDGIFVTKFVTVYPTNMQVRGNFIGTDATGTVAVPNLRNGIELEYCRDSLFGGTGAGEGNLISGNHDHGVRFDGGDESAHPNRVVGNWIGTNAFGTGPLGNGGAGAYYALSARGFDLGGAAPGEPNVIAYNAAGIASASGRPVRFRPNVIHSNGGLGVDRGSDGVTPNQAPGTFVYQNFPILTSASTSVSGTSVSGTLSSGYALAYTVHVFANPVCDPSGYGEARTYLGSLPVTTTAGAETPFSTTFPTPLPAGSYLTALAVAPDDASNDGAASELSFCRQVSGGAPPDSVPLAVLAVAPGRAGNGGDVTAAVTGQGILPGAAVRLERAGSPDVAGTDVRVDPSGAFLTAVFPLAGAAEGAWDVVVTNPGPVSATLAGALQVEAATEPDVWADILGRGLLVVRAGREQTFFLVFGNRGNVDAPASHFVVTVPRQLRVTFVEEVDGSKPVVTLDLPRTTGGTGESQIHVYVPSVPAGSSRAVGFGLLTIEADPGEFGQEVHVGVWQLTSELLGPVVEHPIDPNVTLGTTVLDDSPDHLEWLLHVSDGSVSGDVHYEVTWSDVPFESAPSLTKTVSASGIEYDFRVAFDPGGGSGLSRPDVPFGGGILGKIGIPPELMEQMGPIVEKVGGLMQSNAWGLDSKEAANRILGELRPEDLQRMVEGLQGLQAAQAGTQPLTPEETAKAAELQELMRVMQKEYDANICGMARVNATLMADELGLTADEISSMSCDDLLEKIREKPYECPFPPPSPLQPTACKPPRVRRHDRPLRVFLAIDPNEKAGPGGAGGPAHYVDGETPLSYTITFENVETATAAAQEVVVTDPLDSSKLDLSTFELGPISFGSRVVGVPPGLTSFSADVDLRPDVDLIARVTGGLDPSTGVASWHFYSLDPATGQPTADPILGFLPPNVATPEGEGHVSFTVRAKTGQGSGTEIHNQASIVFDANAPILTADWLNTLDVTAPSSQVAALPASVCSGIPVQWSGTDAHSGVARYDVWASEDGGPTFLWQADTTATSAVFYGAVGSTYAFYSIARDAAGNEEAPPGSPDATTTVGDSTPLVDLLAPSSGPAAGGAFVTLSGSGFETGATVAVGGSPAAGVSVTDPATMTGTFPALAPGALYDVAAGNASGCTDTLAKGWLADFTDVGGAHPFHDFVEKIFRRGVTAGCSGGNYCPDNPVTRAQMAVFLVKAKYNLSLTPPPASGTLFNDVPAGSFAADWIEQLAAEGISGGCGGGNYCPGNSVTRAQMAVFLLKSEHGALFTPPPATGVFADVPPGSFAADWIEQLAAEGVTGGCGGGNYCPNNPVTRGQMAVFLSKTFGF